MFLTQRHLQQHGNLLLELTNLCSFGSAGYQRNLWPRDPEVGDQMMTFRGWTS
jgi:hypothetical protein